MTKIIRKVSIFKTFQVQKIGFKSIEVKDNFINKKWIWLTNFRSILLSLGHRHLEVV